MSAGGCYFNLNSVKKAMTQTRKKQFKGSLKRVSTELISDLDLFSCPSCGKYIVPPSICCIEGHFICISCRKNLKKCPTCGATSFPNERNAIYDQILRNIHYPCQNHDDGCEEFLKISEFANHLKVCPFTRVFCKYEKQGCPMLLKTIEKYQHEELCPYGISCKILKKPHELVKTSCNWRGPREELRSHVDSCHNKFSWLPNGIESNVEFTWILPLGMNFENIELVTLADVSEMFYFYMKSSAEEMQFIAIQQIKINQKSPQNDEYFYSVEFRLQAKKLLLVNKVVKDSIEDVYSNENCCAIPYSGLRKNFHAERAIDCYIKIYKMGQTSNSRRRITTFMGSDFSTTNNTRNSLDQAFRMMNDIYTTGESVT